MQRTNIYLEEAQTAALDRRARERGISRAELIRSMLEAQLGGSGLDLESDLDAIRASSGVLADLAVASREPDERARHLDELWRTGE